MTSGVTSGAPDQALSDIKVLDFTHHIAGPYCTKLLADYGADVIKIERPDLGDGARRLGPFPGDIPHSEKSGLFLHLNTNKRSLTLNLRTATAQDIVLRLAREADVVVESFRPGAMAGFGLDYDSLQAVNPALVVTSISNFGQTGPYRDYRLSEIVSYGMGGEMYSTGLEDRQPLKLGGTVTMYQAGAVAATATMGALFGTEQEGEGQHVDVSIMETQVGSIDRRMSMLLAYQYCGEISRRLPFGTSNFASRVFPCADGYVELTIGMGYFPRVLRMLGDPEEFSDTRWRAPQALADPDNQAEFDEYFLTWCLERSKAEVWAAAQGARVLSAQLNTIGDLVQDPHFIQRGAFAQVEHPEAGTLTYPGRPFIMGETPWAVRRPAPLLGQHNEEVLSDLGYTRAELVLLRQNEII